MSSCASLHPGLFPFRILVNLKVLKFPLPGLKAGAAGSAAFWVLFAVTRAVFQWKRYKLKVKSK